MADILMELYTTIAQSDNVEFHCMLDHVASFNNIPLVAAMAHYVCSVYVERDEDAQGFVGLIGFAYFMRNTDTKQLPFLFFQVSEQCW